MNRGTIRVQEFAVPRFTAGLKAQVDRGYREFLERHGMKAELSFIDSLSERSRKQMARRGRKAAKATDQGETEGGEA